jgi:serine protease Do
MKRILSLGVIALFALTPSLVKADDQLDTWQTKATDKAEPSIVAIMGKAGKVTGTGVIIDGRGFIITNKHVVRAARTVQVRLIDGTQLTGEVVWGAEAYDLAIVQVEASKTLPALTFAVNGSLKRGHKVLAIGHPYGYEYSIADGIIASLGRSIEMHTGDTLTDMIQTTAPINPGNSGGPLLNEKGELIGINTALRDGAQGIAFAISANTVKRILDKNVPNLKLAGIQGGNPAGTVVSLNGTNGRIASTMPAAVSTNER